MAFLDSRCGPQGVSGSRYSGTWVSRIVGSLFFQGTGSWGASGSAGLISERETMVCGSLLVVRSPAESR